MGATSLPRFNGQLLAAQNLVGAEPYRLLFVGQIGTDGTAGSGTYYQDVESKSIAEIKALFGTKSEMTSRILKAWRKCGQRYSIWAVGLTAAAGTAADADLVVAGSATEDGTIIIKPISESKYQTTVAVSSGDANTVVSAAIEAALDALSSEFPATASEAAGTVTLLANDVGTLGNKYTVQCDDIPAGLTINGNAITDRVQFSSGATDPATTTLFDSVAATRFHSISWPWESAYDSVVTFLEARNVISNEFLQGIAMIGYDDTEANISSKVNGVTPLNYRSLFFAGNRQVSGASVIIEPPDWRVAEFLAIEGLRLTEDAPISQYVTVTSPLDVLGGSALASLGYYNTPLPDTDPVDASELFTGTEQGNLKDDGYTIIGVNGAGSSIIMGEVVSTYKTDALGNEDVSFKFLNYIRTAYLAMEIFFRTLKADYSQFRLTEGDVVAGRAIVNKEGIEGEYLRIYKLLSGPSYVLTQAGSTAESYFYNNLSITLDLANGKITSGGQLPIVTQIREFNVVFQISFTTGG